LTSGDTSLARAALRRLAGRLVPVVPLDLVYRHEERRILQRCGAVGMRVRLRMPLVVYQPENLTFGDDVDVGEFCVLRASGGLTIGSRVLIAAHAVLTTRGHPEDVPRHGRVTDAPITVEDDVWIGAGAVVLPGVVIGRGAIVAAGAVVTTTVDPMTVVAGVPARPIKQIAESGGVF
jgi:galactoside O-acetyltransferase